MQAGFEDGAVLPSLDGFQLSFALTGRPAKAFAAVPLRPARRAAPLTVGALFKEFIAFYTTKFDVRNEAVSVRSGRRAPPGLLLPLHIVLAEGGSDTEVGLNIEDPFEPRRNLGATLTSCGLARFREELTRAASLLLVQEASLTQLLEPWAPEETRSSD